MNELMTKTVNSFENSLGLAMHADRSSDFLLLHGTSVPLNNSDADKNRLFWACSAIYLFTNCSLFDNQSRAFTKLQKCKVRIRRVKRAQTI